MLDDHQVNLPRHVLDSAELEVMQIGLMLLFALLPQRMLKLPAE